FLARAGELLAGRRGRALLVNVPTTEHEAREVVEGGHGPTAILVDGPRWEREEDLVPIRPLPPPPKKKLQTPGGRAPAAMLKLALACGLITLVAALVVWEAWRATRPR